MSDSVQPLVRCGPEPDASSTPTPRMQVASRGHAMVIRLIGRLEDAGTARVQHRLLKCLADVPSVVLVDAWALRSHRGVLERLLADVTEQNELWPRVPMVVIGSRHGPSDVPGDLADRPLLCFAPSVVHAMTHLPRPSRTRHTTPLAATTVSAPRARALVSLQCRDWGADHLAGSAELVASELVTNAICHVGYGIRLSVETDGDCVAVEVRDPDPEPPELTDPDALDERGRGLDILCSTASSWGCLPTRTGGKVVWAAWALSEGYAQACADHHQAS